MVIEKQLEAFDGFSERKREERKKGNIESVRQKNITYFVIELRRWYKNIGRQ